MTPRARRFIATLVVASAAASLLAWTIAPGGTPWERPTAHAAPGPTYAPVAERARAPSARGGWLTAHVVSPVLLRSAPGGPRIARLGPRTEFGSPRVLSVVRRRGDWLGVTVPQAGNGRLGWVNARRVRLGRVQRSVVIELSRRRLIVRAGKRTLEQISIGIGASTSPTPVGRFGVTDRLRITGASPYGCCALALSGRQSKLPASWTGGDRIAIHATPGDRDVGDAASHGCLHARAADMRRLLRAVPLGAPVFVKA